MKWWSTTVGDPMQMTGIKRLRRILTFLAIMTCATATVLHWRSDNFASFQQSTTNENNKAPPTWSWTCREDRCVRQLASQFKTPQSLFTCNMLCASTQLWPQPSGPVTLATEAVPIRGDQFSLDILSSPSEDVTQHLIDSFGLIKEDLMLQEFHTDINVRVYDENLLKVRVLVTVMGSDDPRLLLSTDESYNLTLQPIGRVFVANISAYSFCGAQHAFQTLSQLIWLDPYADSLFMLKAATIRDAPAFRYRGLLLDTARNYFPVPDILRTIDAMAASKLNTFHWHASDSQSFPLKLNSVPQMAENGAYGQGAIYTTKDIKDIVRRARLRGIRVVIEIDTPAHVGRAWSWGPQSGLGHLAHCIDAQPWSTFCGVPPCGQLNPKNPHVYDLLEQMYAEIIQLTGVDDVFHLGGDEVSEQCWARHFNDSDLKELWLEFTSRALVSLERANGGKIPEMTLLWSSELTLPPYLDFIDPRLSIQIWDASNWGHTRIILNTGFRSIISHVDAWYLDCGFGSWLDNSRGQCFYNTWQQIYEHRPWYGWTYFRIDGGTACLWSEQVGPGGLDARLWPRAAAFAERLWSDRTEGVTPDVYLRLDTQRTRLIARGVRAAPLWPRWCSHNPHACIKKTII